MSAPRSPFKFLDSYTRDDAAFFFGREAEADALHAMLARSKLVLVYGPSGVGKSSVIQCGLESRYRDVDWLPVPVRRGDGLNAALRRRMWEAMAAVLEQAGDPVPARFADSDDLVDAARTMFRETLLPVYLILDQFEELFVLGGADEREAFFADLARLLGSEVAVRVVISIREEYLALLSSFEPVVPELFAARLRIEPMTRPALAGVIASTLRHFGVALEGGAATADAIIRQLGEGRGTYQLAYLQVYLDALWRRANAEGGTAVTPELVERTGPIDTVMGAFLEEQTAAVQAEAAALGAGPETVRSVLEAFTTLDGTKEPLTAAALHALVPAEPPAVLDACLRLLERARLLRCDGAVFELAHDSLGTRIAARRGAERTAALRVEKIVRDRMAAFPQARTLLSRQELSVVAQFREQLQLDPAAAEFVGRSERAARRKRVTRIAAVSGTIAVLAASTVVSVVALGRVRAAEFQKTMIVLEATATAEELANELGGRMESLRGTGDVRAKLYDYVLKLSRDLHGGKVPAGNTNYAWQLLYRSYVAYDDKDLALSRRLRDEAEDLVAARLAAGTADASLRELADALGTWRMELTTGRAERLRVARENLRKLPNAVNHFHVAVQLIALGSFAEAERYLAAGRKRVDPKNREEDLMFLEYGMGSLRFAQGRFDLAAVPLQSASERADALGDDAPSDFDFYRAAVYCRLAETVRRLGRGDEAEAWTAEAKEIIDTLDISPASDLHETLKLCGWMAPPAAVRA